MYNTCKRSYNQSSVSDRDQIYEFVVSGGAVARWISDKKSGRMQDERCGTMEEDERFMREAVKQARKAAAIEEVPIGCVIVRENKIIARGYNKRNTQGCTLAHAELIAIRKASRKLNDWRLEDCTIYVTLEPCPMCAGAILQARIPRLVIGTMNPKAGCAGSIINILQNQQFNHQVEQTQGVLQQECQQMLQDFFRELRRSKKKENN